MLEPRQGRPVPVGVAGLQFVPGIASLPACPLGRGPIDVRVEDAVCTLRNEAQVGNGATREQEEGPGWDRPGTDLEGLGPDPARESEWFRARSRDAPLVDPLATLLVGAGTLGSSNRESSLIHSAVLQRPPRSDLYVALTTDPPAIGHRHGPSIGPAT